MIATVNIVVLVEFGYGTASNRGVGEDTVDRLASQTDDRGEIEGLEELSELCIGNEWCFAFGDLSSLSSSNRRWIDADDVPLDE